MRAFSWVPLLGLLAALCAAQEEALEELANSKLSVVTPESKLQPGSEASPPQKTSSGGGILDTVHGLISSLSPSAPAIPPSRAEVVESQGGEQLAAQTADPEEVEGEAAAEKAPIDNTDVEESTPTFDAQPEEPPPVNNNNNNNNNKKNKNKNNNSNNDGRLVRRYNEVTDSVLKLLSRSLSELEPLPITINDDVALSALESDDVSPESIPEGTHPHPYFPRALMALEASEPEPEPEPESESAGETGSQSGGGNKKNKRKKNRKNKNKNKNKDEDSDMEEPERGPNRKNKKNKNKNKNKNKDEDSDMEEPVRNANRKTKKDKNKDAANPEEEEEEVVETRPSKNKKNKNKGNKNKRNKNKRKNNRKNKRGKKNRSAAESRDGRAMLEDDDGKDEEAPAFMGRRKDAPERKNRKNNKGNKKGNKKNKNRKNRKNNNKKHRKNQADGKVESREDSGPVLPSVEERELSNAYITGLTALSREGDVMVDASANAILVDVKVKVGPLMVQLADSARALTKSQVSTTLEADMQFRIKNKGRGRQLIRLVDLSMGDPEEVNVARLDLPLEPEVVSAAQDEVRNALDVSRLGRIFRRQLEAIFKEDNVVQNLEHHELLKKE